MSNECCSTEKNNGGCVTMKKVLWIAVGVAAVLLAWKLAPSVIRYRRMSRM